ncbi:MULTISPECIES: histidine kinase [unclassified Knoellia]|uniref:ATP-binding protein n=1 Tax=Knoellia altitudinis TaxID=3404795 RepID=UPI003612DADD
MERRYGADTMTTQEALRRAGLPRAAAAIAVAAWGLAVLAVVLVVVARPALGEGLWFFAVDVAVACVYGTVAALIISRRPHPVGWLLALAAVGGGVAALGFGYPVLAAQRPGLPGAELVAWLQSTAWVPGTLALFLVVPWLVRDHPVGRARWGVAIGALLIVAMLAAQLLQWQRSFTVVLVAVISAGLVAAFAVEHRRRHGPVAERNGLGWLALGAGLLAVSFTPLVLPYDAIPLPVWTTPALHLLSQVIYPAAILIAVLRSRMWGLRLAVSRTVLAGLLTVSLVAVYLAVTLVATRFLPDGGTSGLVGAATVAVSVQPARLWLERRVHHLVYGASAFPDHVVRRLGNHLRLTESTDDLLHGLAADIGTAMRLESVSVSLPDREPVVWGIPHGHPFRVPLAHRGEPVGDLAVTLPGGESLGARGEQTLTDLATVVATAAAVTRAAAEVEDARDRLARARLEERRVIRREIHDGLGPSLAGLRLGLQGARNLMSTDPHAAATLLETLQAELEQRVSDVRTLSHSLLPPALDELGLAAALAELSARHAEDGAEVTLALAHDDVLAPQTAAAAYAIVSEAVTNTLRHSGARSVLVETRSTTAGLHVTVVDRGRGVAGGARAGVGTRSMRERAEELGGSLEITTAPGEGTRVEAVLPHSAVTSRG